MCKAWEEQWLDGKQVGISEGMQTGMRRGLISYMQDCLENKVEKDTIIAKSMKIFKVSKEEAEKYFEECTLQTV